jgi:hypothetical protein
MRVGVYIDGFNLYFGGSAIFGASAPGWKWLDMRRAFGALARVHWPATAVVEPVVYCTARISARVDPTGYKRQETYLRALTRAASVDRVEYGKFFEKVKTRPIALAGPERTSGRRNGAPSRSRQGRSGDRCSERGLHGDGF